jgi:16S rRNA (guanine966-N2)-methyltransferase
VSGRRNRLRIVGGSHRGRVLHFPDGRGLRPTADRVRETLFNWLQGEMSGVRALDLFAGSGALGLEALSRGAATAVFVERARPAVQALRENLRLLGLDDRARVVAGDARRFLVGPPEPFDLVFLDPPFADDLLGEIARQLTEGGWLAAGAWIYLEQDSARDWPPLPEHWRAHRQTRAGQAACRLMQFDPA